MVAYLGQTRSARRQNVGVWLSGKILVMCRLRAQTSKQACQWHRPITLAFQRLRQGDLEPACYTVN